MNRYAVVNPATGVTVAEYPTTTSEELAGSIASADSAYKGWSVRTPEIRAQFVRRVSELYTERRISLAKIIVREMGKPYEQALGEVDFSAAIYLYYAENGPRFLVDEPIGLLAGEGSAIVRHSPLGAILGIMPWNFPYYQVARFAAPNLVIGNTILLKHAPQCPESALAIEQIFSDAGLPDGAYTNLFATNEQVADTIADPRVHGVSLTGSERAGSAVAEVAGRNLKKVVLELGGSDPFIVLSTDDLDATVGLAVNARLDNNGQSCNAAKRFIVIEDLYDQFVEKLVVKFGEVVAADPTSSSTVLGPLSSLAAAERLQQQVDAAIAQGASLKVGGNRRGAFYPATVLTDVSTENDAYREEFFGPVAVVYRVADEGQAIAVANDTPYGLGSYVFTTDRQQATRIANRLEAGMVFINTVLADGAELPFGGVKMSGFGRELGRAGLGEFANKKLIRVV